MVATYWQVGRQIVVHEQAGRKRADYGKALIERLSEDLTARFGRGFSRANLEYMRRFYNLWQIPQTVSGESTGSAQTPEPANVTGLLPPSSVSLSTLMVAFPLPWSHYVKLLSVDKEEARRFYEEEAIRGGWSERQLERQINSLFFERTLLSKNKAAMLKKGQLPIATDAVTPDEAIKDPLVLEFLDLKDEYSESDLEEALVHQLEDFLLELGSDFTFVGRQRRLRLDNEWYRVDLVFFHRRLRCLVVIDLKLGKLTHADIGQMHLYLNYAKAHWTHPDENPPVGLILCAGKGTALARYALEGLPNKVLAAQYKVALPEEKVLIAELEKGREQFERKRKKR